MNSHTSNSDATRVDAVRLERVSFAYDERCVLEDVNLTITQRNFACIIGPNGGGKTTLMKLMLGLIEPTRGNVHVLGKSARQARHRIGYLPQSAPLDPLFPVTVLDVVLMGRLGGAHRFGPYGAASRTAAQQALSDAGARQLARKPFGTLSGGQRQRVLIARALVSKPVALFLDEPTSGLDIEAEEQFLSMLRRLNERVTIVMVSHDVEFVSRHVDTAICVNRKVHVHTGQELVGGVVRELYGREIRMVRHVASAGHTHGPDCHHERTDEAGDP